MASAKTWFVQTGFGTILGPMPEDALQEMVRTGALVRSDQVRDGLDGEWRPAAETPGLFDVATTASVSESEVPAVENIAPIASINAELLRPERPVAVPLPQHPESPITPTPPLALDAQQSATMDSSPLAKGRLIPPPAPTTSAQLVAPPIPTEPVVPPADGVPSTSAVDVGSTVTSREDQLGTEAPDEAAPLSRSAPPEDDLIVRWRSERDRTREELGTVSLAAEMSQAHDEEDFAPELPADLLSGDDSVKPAPPTVSVLAEDKTRRLEIRRPAFLDQVAGLEDGPRVHEETVQQKWDRWRRSLPSWQIAAGVVVVLFAAWWFWPRSSRGIYDRYVAVWDEWKTRRTDLRDPSGWEQFLQRTEKELNASVPYLEKHARASDREKQLLLFIGRDCFQKMLNRPRQIGSPREKQLQILFAILHEMYEPSAAGQSLEAVVGADGLPPPLKEESPPSRLPRSDSLPEEKPPERQP